MPQRARKALDTADIVRDGLFTPTPRTSETFWQLTRRLCLVLEGKGVVVRKLIEDDRLASGEPLDVV